MVLPIKIKRKIRQLYLICTVGIFLGIVFVIFADGFQDLFFFINGATIGLLIGLFAGIMELFVFKTYFKRVKFYVTFLLRLAFYVALVLIVTFNEMVIARMIRDGTSFSEAMRSEDFVAMIDSGEFLVANIYILATILGFNFTLQMNRKLGHGVLMNFMTGQFYNPIYKQRIILFMRIIHSSEIIEKIGRLKFHQLIKEVMRDISGPILRNSGMIYEYVEDEVVITWTESNGIENGHCIRTFFEAREALHVLKEKYFRKYSFVPVLKAALHCGKVVRGEIGDIKCEVVLTGDVMNTTARIMTICGESDQNILISRTLVERLEIPKIFYSEPFEEAKIRGKEKPVELHSIKEAQLEKVTTL
jgi:adenylate cyclase